jgi:hypothetical protein
VQLLAAGQKPAAAFVGFVDPRIHPDSSDKRPKSGDLGPGALAFTVAPHLQTINYRGRFSRFVSI